MKYRQGYTTIHTILNAPQQVNTAFWLGQEHQAALAIDVG